MIRVFWSYELRVKFRAFGVTLGTLTDAKERLLVELPAEVASRIPVQSWVAYNERGVYLKLNLRIENKGA